MFCATCLLLTGKFVPGCGLIKRESTHLALSQGSVQGELRGVGLDVFENEPDVPEELIAFDNVVLSPHCAVVTPECFEALKELIAANLKAFFSNEPLRSVISLE
ncbi:Erythronate-4-phosphate dehydrogenase [Parasponia andersonii]|uniref:Erythronate-4-phosphate dehydrogenase n=1 Tax=Parasponia andersonii TaxID=3476 RepID=A0A2P5C8V9_PARAD|nr:Erythronate-4-phosphate dehydrogenase [Parasponia andersonii]